MESSVPQAASLQAFSETFGDRSVQLTTVLAGTGQIWFRGTDVASSLGYSDPGKAVRTHVDDEDKVKLENLRGGETAGLKNRNERSQIFISESGLYSLILTSKKPEAKEFKRWVTSVVLPQIRQTGSFTATPPQLPGPTRDEGPSEADVHSSRLARLRAIQAAKEVADQWGFTVSDDLARHARMAVDEVLLPVAWEQRDMVDAADPIPATTGPRGKGDPTPRIGIRAMPEGGQGAIDGHRSAYKRQGLRPRERAELHVHVQRCDRGFAPCRGL